MKYQKIINFLDNTPNQPSKVRTRNRDKINDDSYRTYSINSQIEFKSTMLKSGLCQVCDAYILAKRIVTVPNTGTVAFPDNGNKKSNI